MSAWALSIKFNFTGRRRELRPLLSRHGQGLLASKITSLFRAPTIRCSPARAFPGYRTIFLVMFRLLRTVSRRTKKTRTTMTTVTANPRAIYTGESGMTLIAVMMMMAIFAVALLAVAPSVQQDV